MSMPISSMTLSLFFPGKSNGDVAKVSCFITSFFFLRCELSAGRLPVKLKKGFVLHSEARPKRVLFQRSFWGKRPNTFRPKQPCQSVPLVASQSVVGVGLIDIAGWSTAIQTFLSPIPHWGQKMACPIIPTTIYVFHPCFPPEWHTQVYRKSYC